MTGLIGWWPLHESSGGTARDLSGNGNHGALNGGVTQGVAGKAGLTAYSFDGSDDYISPINNAGLSTNEDFSFSVWVRFDGNADNRDRIVGLYDGADDIFFFGIESSSNSGSDKIHIRIGHIGGNEIQDSGIGPKIRDGGWHHIVLSWDSSSSEVMVFVDNSLEYSKSSTVDDPFDDSEVFDIGRRSDNSQYLTGNICYLRIYNRVLTPQEIQTLYEWGNGDYTNSQYHDGSDSGAVSRWKFDGDVTDSWSSNDGSDNTSAGYSTDSINGQAKSFDGTDDYTVVDPFPDLSGSPVTLSAWVYLDGRNDYSNSVSTADQTGSNRQNALSIQHGSQTGDRLLTYDSSGNSYTLGYSITQGDWYHIVAVHDSSDLRGYINGAEMANSPLSIGEPLGQSTAVFVKGANAQLSSTSFMPGKVDDVRIYNRALSPSEVFQLYQWGTRGRDMRKLTVNKRGGT